MGNNQSTPEEASGAGTTVDFKELAEELSLPEEYLQNRLSGTETKEEAMTKLAKSSFEATKTADKLKGEKSSLMQERDKFAELAKGSLKTNEPPTSKKSGYGRFLDNRRRAENTGSGKGSR